VPSAFRYGPRLHDLPHDEGRKGRGIKVGAGLHQATCCAHCTNCSTQRNPRSLGCAFTLDVLLTGRCRDTDEAARLHAEGIEYDPFDEWGWTEAQRRALIDEHRAQLLAEARRQRVTPNWPDLENSQMRQVGRLGPDWSAAVVRISSVNGYRQNRHSRLCWMTPALDLTPTIGIPVRPHRGHTRSSILPPRRAYLSERLMDVKATLRIGKWSNARQSCAMRGSRYATSIQPWSR
jgi:hypothetical protein